MGTLKGEGFWGGGNVVGKIRAAVSRTGTMDGPALHRIIQDREHPVIKARKHQIAINLLGICGGRPYVNARLSRFPGETKFEWEGGDRTDGSKVTGRRDRAPNVPHLRRIANKINEYNFSTPPIREGADPEIVSDITATGDGINRLMKTVNDYITACGWCWINVNAPAATGEGDPTLAEIQERKLRPYWQIYSPISVVDWCHDDTGSLLWLLTDTVSTDNSNPFAPLVAHRKRTLWQSASHAGQPTAMSTAFWYGKDGESIGPTRTEQAIRGMTELPWVMCGSASAEPNGFDDMESINKTILDLESCNDENFYKAMFPQRYIPISALENAREQFQVTAEEGINMIFGLGWPILLGPDDQPPGVVMPPSDQMGAVRGEIKERKRELFDAVGMMIDRETRQVESAEAKAWNHIDVEHFLRERATILEECESKAVAISAAWDSRFNPWSPQYNRDFDLADFKTVMESIVLGEQVSQPIEMKRALLRRMNQAIDRDLAGGLTDEERDAIKVAIENYEGPSFEPIG